MVQESIKQLFAGKMFFKFLLNQRYCSKSDIFYVQVDPKKISHSSLIPDISCRLSGPEAAYGSFIGCHDFLKKPFKKNFIYTTVGQLLRGKSWSSTPYYKKVYKNEGKAKAITQLEKLDYLIKKLSHKGYLSQYELENANITQKIGTLDVPRNETIIGMDRHGTMFRIKGGRHRLAIAQHIEIPEIPAILTLYHKNALGLLPEKRRKITGAPADFRPI